MTAQHSSLPETPIYADTAARAAPVAFDAVLHVALMEADDRQGKLFDRMLGGVQRQPADAVQLQPVAGVAKAAKTKRSGNDAPEVEAMTVAAFKRMVRNDVDYFYDKRGILPREVRENLEVFREEFKSETGKAKNFEELLAVLRGIIEREHDRLVYQTNDYMTASIKEDYFNEYVDTLTAKLAEQRMLDSSQCERLDELEEMYDLGLRSYNILNERIGVASAGEYRSILQQAEAEREEALKRAKKGKPVKDLPAFAHDVVRNALLCTYGINVKEGVPSPYLAVLAKVSDTLTRAQLRDMHPHMDFRDPELTTAEEYQTRFMAVLQTWQERFAKNPTLDNCFGIYRDLQKQIHMLEHLPEDFTDMVSAAAEAAKKHVNAQLRHIQSDHMAMLQTPVARMRKMIEGFNPNYEQLPELQRGFNAVAAAMEDLPTDMNKFDLVDQLENKLDHVGTQVDLYGFHSATYLAVREYLTAFRRHLGAALSAKGDTDLSFLGALKELETKADLMHENTRVLGHWLMEDTNGGNDNLFYHTLFTVGADKFPMRVDDYARVREHAEAIMSDSAEARHIAPSLSNLPLIPLIYARCEQIAAQELGYVIKNQVVAAHFGQKQFARIREKRAPHDTWAGYVTRHDFEAEQAQTAQEAQEQYKMIHDRTLALLHQAMMRLVPPALQPEAMVDEAAVTPQEAAAARDAETRKDTVANMNAADKGADEDDAPKMPDIEHPIELTAHNLRLVMEFLDSVERSRATSKMH